ncbi:Gfo/Idh/MocA family protein [Conexibacter woesei]|uniref:Oxidoreductase domain protein n=1 Tax=Conexibacter woesei (strain DSM 14684 / CCUG 47730 / CIP 108061 / JCM 11494 / NBRC 100937 / ID131577) TaxID=469383 RepID=D3F7X8_CONWI|nr:Gfo/Idh/MocA family oxidoreductase [Conexibacter woesei]ADB52872.1 oxidoreductase domain protein [Conexibacter woesei DSM 14684]
MSAAEIGVGMWGYGFMGRTHANAYRQVRHLPGAHAARPRQLVIGGRDGEAARQAAATYGFARHASDWREIVADPEVQLFDNSAWHDVHEEPCIAAAQAGKHVLCEKPLALDADAGRRMLAAVERAGVQHMVAFNYRFAPAVRRARELIAAGQLGEVRRIHVCYFQDHQADASLPSPWGGRSQTGVLDGLGSHAIDLARFLVGEIESVTADIRTFIPERGAGAGSRERIAMTEDDAFSAQVAFSAGALGVLEAAWVYAGSKNALRFEVNGSEGSLSWNLEDLNHLHFNRVPSGSGDPGGTRSLLVTDRGDPYVGAWWPPGHVLGWEHLHANLVAAFVDAIATGEPVAPWGATFADGLRAIEVAEAIRRSAASGRRETVGPPSIGARS